MLPADQNPPEPSNIIYDANIALEFFKSFGKIESVQADEILFEIGQKAGFFSFQSNKMYLLLSGKVSIQAAYESLDDITPGEIFGEFTPTSSLNTIAIAKEPCRLLSLNESQLLKGLKKTPEFVLMLMGVFILSLRKDTPTTNQMTPKAAANKSSSNNSVLSPKMLQQLVKKLGTNAIMEVPPQRVLFKEGGAAMLMYVILNGSIITSVGGKKVGRSGSGAVIGEIALVDQKPRTASVTTETNCSLLSLNRQKLIELIETLPEFGIALLRILSTRACLGNPTTSSKEDEWDW
jgi:CRP-like cAMP-binding protein